MRGDDPSRKAPPSSPEAALWRRSRVLDLTPDEAERFIDLAGFADGRLDADERDRVAERLAADPIAAGDVAAARALGAIADRVEAMPDALFARAVALVGGGDSPPGEVIPFAPRHHDPSKRYGIGFYGAARWGSLVAAMAVAGWLGFTLGMDASLSFSQTRQPGDSGFLSELLDPSTGLMGDMTDGRRT